MNFLATRVAAPFVILFFGISFITKAVWSIARTGAPVGALRVGLPFIGELARAIARGFSNRGSKE